MDLYGCRIVGWAMSERINAQMTLDALGQALETRTRGPEVLHHSDRGSQYASAAYRKLLEHHGIECSMSRKGDCWDNAVVESFSPR